MSKKKNTPDTDTYAIGPSVCKNFTNKDLCHYCVANRIYGTSLCFARPTGSIVGNEDEQRLQMLTEVIGGPTETKAT